MKATIERFIEAPAEHPNGLDWYQDTLLVIGGKTRIAYQVDPQTGEVLHQVQTPCHNGVIHDGEAIWVVDREPARLYRLDWDTGAEIQTADPTGPVPIGLAYDGKHIYCGEHHHGICKVDPWANKVLAQYPGQADRTHGIAWDGETLWHADANLAKIFRLDVNDGGRLLDSFDAPEGIMPHGLTWDGETLWFAGDEPARLYRLTLEM